MCSTYGSRIFESNVLCTTCGARDNEKAVQGVFAVLTQTLASVFQIYNSSVCAPHVVHGTAKGLRWHNIRFAASG